MLNNETIKVLRFIDEVNDMILNQLADDKDFSIHDWIKEWIVYCGEKQERYERLAKQVYEQLRYLKIEPLSHAPIKPNLDNRFVDWQWIGKQIIFIFS